MATGLEENISMFAKEDIAKPQDRTRPSKTAKYLPTHPKYAEKIPQDVDATKIAQDWLNAFGKAMESGDSKGFVDTFWEEGWWRDKFALLWDFRGLSHDLLQDAFEFTNKKAAPKNFQLNMMPPPAVADMFEDVSMLQLHFTFDTKVAKCIGVANLIRPKSQEGYKAWTVFTASEELHQFPEKERPNGTDRQFSSWDRQRAAQINEAIKDCVVLIIGGGHSGLNLAARLSAMGINYLLIERNPRIGDNWRFRYENLSLHDPVFSDHMPYLPYPKHWPIFSPAYKLANWLETYVDHLDLNVLTGTKATDAKFDEKADAWTVKISRDGKEQVMQTRHVVLATGLGGGTPRMPKPVPGQDSFPGVITHGFHFDSGRKYAGKRALVVGTSSSGFDIAYDLHKHGAQVTMLQRSPTFVMSIDKGIPFLHKPLYWEGGPPTEIADRIYQAFPMPVLKLIVARNIASVAEMDKDLLEGLEKKGFRTWAGEEGTGPLLIALNRGG